MIPFISGISVMCFAASYLVSLGLEVTRLWFRSGLRGAVMVGFASAGLLAHTLYLGYRAAQAPNLPLSSPFDWYLLGAWLLAAVYLYLTLTQRKASTGVFVLPLVLGLIAAAGFASRDPYARQAVQPVWGIAHGVFILVGLVAAAAAFAMGVMYLVHRARLKSKRPARRFLKLPSLEWLENASGRAIVFSLAFLGLGMLSGVVLNVIRHHAHGQMVSWTDPLIISSATLFACMLGLTIFNRCYQHVDRSRKVLWLTLLTLVFLLVALGLNLWMPHGGGQSAGGRTADIDDRSLQSKALQSLSPSIKAGRRPGLASGQRQLAVNTDESSRLDQWSNHTSGLT